MDKYIEFDIDGNKTFFLQRSMCRVLMQNDKREGRPDKKIA